MADKVLDEGFENHNLNSFSRRWFLHSAGIGIAALALKNNSVAKFFTPQSTESFETIAATAIKNISIEIPILQWGDSKRPDGTTRHWRPEPVIEMGATLLCVAYRPLNEKGERFDRVGMTPPGLLKKTLLNTKQELDECHKHAVKVIGYADCIMFHPETLEAEGINTKNLYALDEKGQYIINKDWDKSGAPLSCISNPNWVSLQKQVARVTAEAGFDGLFFDVYPYAIRPGYLCCCEHCKDSWSKYSKELFGSPQPMPGTDSFTLDFSKPVDRAFKTWRLQGFVDFVRAIETDIQKSFPAFTIMMNHGAGTPDFTYEAIHGGLSHPSSELWHINLGDDSSLYMYNSVEAADSGQLIGLLNFGKQAKPAYRYRVSLAEAYGSGGLFYFTGSDEESKEISKTYINFFKRYQQWFNDTRSDAECAVLYSWRDQAFVQGNPKTKAVVEFDAKRNYYQSVAGALSTMGVANDCLLVEKSFSFETLQRYSIIVVPHLSLINDKQAEILKEYVRKGGKLLAIGELGNFTESGQEFIQREQSLLKTWTGKKPEGSWNAPLGKGIIAFTPKMTMISDSKDATRIAVPGQSFTPEFTAAWKAVATNPQIRIESSHPMECTIRANGNSRTIHLIRLGDSEKIENSTVSIDYRIPKGYKVKDLILKSPDFSESEIPFTQKVSSDRILVTFSKMKNYVLVGLGLEKK